MTLHARQRPRRVALRGVALLLLLLAPAAALALTMRAAAGSPLDPYIPNEQALIDAGLSGTPAPNQPTAPVAVDRVLVDGAVTYVQYHVSSPADAHGDIVPRVTDDQGVQIGVMGYGYASSPTGWTLPFPLPAWIPWRPTTIRHAVVIIDSPLLATAHAAVLRFSASAQGETVRVPLDLSALAHRRIARPNTTVRAAGLTLTVQELTFTHLTLAYALPGSRTAGAPSVQLVDHGGRTVPAALVGGGCSGDSSATTCSTHVTFPPQRSGVRLTLTIPIFQINGHPLKGPWRYSFVIP